MKILVSRSSACWEPTVTTISSGCARISSSAMTSQIRSRSPASPCALQYCTAQGDAGLRERICDVMALEEIRAHPDEIVVTVGSQQALDLLTRIFIDPGDVILAEAPSYV